MIAPPAQTHLARPVDVCCEHKASEVVVRCRRPASASAPLRTLLLHGLGSSPAVWDSLVSRAAPRLELWDAELPWSSQGTGGWAQDPDVYQWAARAIGMVDGGVDVLLAHSFAANALLGLLDRTGGCGQRATVLVSPFYKAGSEDFDWATISYYLNKFDCILEEGIRVSSGGRLQADVQREMALRVRDRIGPYGWIRFFDTYLRTPHLDTARLTGPFLVIGGDRDFASPPTDSQALARALPNCSLAVLPGCGHFAMAEYPDRFAALVHGFLDSSSVRPPGRAGHLDTHYGQERTR